MQTCLSGRPIRHAYGYRCLLIACLLFASAWPAMADNPAPARSDAQKVAAFLDGSSIQYESVSVTAHNPRPDIEHALYAWAKQGATLAVLRSRLAEKYALPPALAGQLVDLTFARVRHDSYLEKPGEREQLLSRYRALYAQYPNLPIIRNELAFAIEDFEACSGVALDPMVQGAEEETLRQQLYTLTQCPSLLTPLTALHPERAETYAALIEEDEVGSPMQLASVRMADALASSAEGGLSPVKQVQIRIARLHAELTAGFVDAAIRALPKADSPLHDPVMSALGVRDRLAIAAAYWLQGDAQSAAAWRALAAQLPASAEDNLKIDENSDGGSASITAAPVNDAQKSEENSEGRGTPFAAASLRVNLDRVLNLALAPDPATDPFSLLSLQYQKQEAGYQEADPYWQSLWTPLLDRLAQREGYPGLVGSDDGWWPKHRREEAEQAVKDCYRCAPALLAAIHLAGERPTVPPLVLASDVVSGGLPAAVTTRMDQQLLATVHWQQLPLPQEWRTPKPQPSPEQHDRIAARPGRDHSPAWARLLPAGELVRYQVDGSRIVAITASQRLDPVGELSSGGYWVSLSSDGGKTFAPPLYTGLRVYQPYVIRPTSKLPLLDGDSLRIEVALRRIDPAKVMLPPIALPVVESKDDLYIRIPLAELARDSDGDGLSDLAEQAMLLDPTVADTDADGLGDAQDPLPQVASSANCSRYSEPLALVLNQILGKSLGAIVTTAAHAGGEPAQGYALGLGTAAQGTEGTTFLVAPAAYFCGISLQHRVIVLTPAQQSALAAARGVFYPIQISKFELSRDGSQGVVVWSATFTGGTLLLKKVNGQWTMEEAGRWIT